MLVASSCNETNLQEAEKMTQPDSFELNFPDNLSLDLVNDNRVAVSKQLQFLIDNNDNTYEQLEATNQVEPVEVENKHFQAKRVEIYRPSWEITTNTENEVAYPEEHSHSYNKHDDDAEENEFDTDKSERRNRRKKEKREKKKERKHKRKEQKKRHDDEDYERSSSNKHHNNHDENLDNFRLLQSNKYFDISNLTNSFRFNRSFAVEVPTFNNDYYFNQTQPKFSNIGNIGNTRWNKFDNKAIENVKRPERNVSGIYFNRTQSVDFKYIPNTNDYKPFNLNRRDDNPEDREIAKDRSRNRSRNREDRERRDREREEREREEREREERDRQEDDRPRHHYHRHGFCHHGLKLGDLCFMPVRSKFFNVVFLILVILLTLGAIGALAFGIFKICKKVRISITYIPEVPYNSNEVNDVNNNAQNQEVQNQQATVSLPVIITTSNSSPINNNDNILRVEGTNHEIRRNVSDNCKFAYPELDDIKSNKPYSQKLLGNDFDNHRDYININRISDGSTPSGN